VSIEQELIKAYELLSSETIESDNGYRKEDFLTYVEAGEWLLAMEELDGVIEDNESPCREFWLHLINAATLMNHSHVTRYKSILKVTS